jgi:purine-binding chemotaxis protein CheW
VNRSGQHETGRDADYLERVFRQRAAALAQPEVSGETRESDAVLIFSLGTERYAFLLEDAIEVVSNTRPVPVPGAPARVAGLIQVRGGVYPVYDLRRMLSVSASESVPAVTILVRAGNRRAGVLVDAAESFRTVQRSDRRAPPHAAAHISWTTDDLIPVLNTSSLFEKESDG